MASLAPQLEKFRTQSAMPLSSIRRSTIITTTLDARENRCPRILDTANSCRNGVSVCSRVAISTLQSCSDETVRRRICSDCRASTSSHLNFQLPSKNFAGFERVGGVGLSCDSSDLECKSSSSNSELERSGTKKKKNVEKGPILGFYLHDLMDQAGIETTHARIARVGFGEEVAKLASGSMELGVVDVARAALEISAEDDALVSHSSVPLPVDSYLERLDSMATEFAGHHLPASSQDLFGALEKYLWIYKGFRVTKARTSRDARDFYLNGVLTRRQGPPLLLGLIYSDVVKRLWQFGTIDFLVDMNLPEDDLSFPIPRRKNPNGESGSGMEEQGNCVEETRALSSGTGPDVKDLNLLTPKNVLVEVLRSLKKLYWPWRSIAGSGEGSDFLEAAIAASRGTVSSASTLHGPFESLFNSPSSERGSEIASARAAQYRLQRGIWTSTTFGDLRRALAASERLVMLGGDNRELRDYGMLLFHAGLYEQSSQYLHAYSSLEVSTLVPPVFNGVEAQLQAKEALALSRLLERLGLIMTERSWNISSEPPPPIVSPPDPW